MGSYTERLKLYKPDIEETSWGGLVNGNFDKIDSAKPQQLGVEPAFIKRSAYNKSFGTKENTVCRGNDPRLEEISSVPSHASPTTKYGVSSENLYGHTKASRDLPLQAGEAYVGKNTHEFSCADHVHPAQDSVSGNSGTATKLANIRNIGITEGVKSTAQPFDGTKDITIPIHEIKSSVIQGNIPLSSLPTATYTKKGCVIVGDGLKIGTDGILKLKDIEWSSTAYKVYSKGSRKLTDLKLGTLSYSLTPNKTEIISVTSKKTEKITLATALKYLYTKKSFVKSDVLPTVFEPSEPLTNAIKYTLPCNIGVVSPDEENVSCTFSFYKTSDKSLISAQEVKNQIVRYTIPLPDRWDYATDTFYITCDIVHEIQDMYMAKIVVQLDTIDENNLQVYL